MKRFLNSILGTSKTRAARAKVARPGRLLLESLEDRLALSTISFSGTAPNRVLLYQAASGEVNSLEISRSGNSFTFAETSGVGIQMNNAVDVSFTVGGNLFNRIEVKLGDENDSVSVLSTNKRIDVFGESGSDVVHIGGSTGMDGISAAVNINGGADAGSTDELFINDQDAAVVNATVRINGTTGPRPTTLSYTVTGATVTRQRLNALNQPFGGPFIVTPTNMESLQLNASNQNDKIAVNSTLAATTVKVRAGDGADTITVARLRDIQSELTVRGNDGVDKLVIDDRSATTGRNYAITTESLKVVGSNSVLWSGIQEVSVQAPNRANTFDVQSMDANMPLTLTGGTLADTVTISDAALTTGQTYTIDAGKVERGGAKLLHSGINSLIVKAGTGDDVFTMKNATLPTLTLNGGTGIDTIDYSAFTTNVVVNMVRAEATKVGTLKSVENATGGNGNDVLVGDANANVLKGLDGKDVLIGGKGADSIFGGAGEDLMIASTTDFDANITKLNKIREVWAGAGTITARTNSLKLGVGTGTTAVKLSDTTVHVAAANDDQAKDSLESNDNFPSGVPPTANTPDWFWGNPGTDTTLDALAMRNGDIFK